MAATANGITWDTDWTAYDDHAIGGTYAEILAGDGGSVLTEWEDVDILNLWFAHMAMGRIGDEGVVIDPYSTELTMPVDADDLRLFLNDCEDLMSSIRNSDTGTVPIRFQSWGEARYDFLFEEYGGEYGLNAIGEAICGIGELLDDPSMTDFVYHAWHDEYYLNDEILNIREVPTHDGNLNYEMTITLTHSLLEDYLEEVNGGMSHAYDFVEGIYRALIGTDLGEELRYFSQEFAEKYGYEPDETDRLIDAIAQRRRKKDGERHLDGAGSNPPNSQRSKSPTRKERDMSEFATTATTNADGTTTYTFTITTDTPSRAKAELLASAGFTDGELCSQLRQQLDGALCVFILDDVMNFLGTSSEEKAEEWFWEHGSWSSLEDQMCEAGWFYLDNI